MKEVSLRVTVALIGIPLLLFLIIKGGYFFFAFILLISLLGQWEMLKLLKAKSLFPQRIPVFIAGILIITITNFGLQPLLISALILIIIIIFVMEMFLNKGSAILNIAGNILAIIYPALFLATLLFLRNNAETLVPGENSGAWFIFNIFIAVWICDTFAYFFGKSFGKHRLFERVSPKKSIEGAVAGLIGSVLAFLTAYWFRLYEISFMISVISGLIVGVGGQLGDLVESWFKRDAGIKDSSNILPGHGGILDRFDSLLFIAPLFLILYLVMI